MTINKDTVNYISALARLRLDDAEALKLAGDLEAILHYADKLNELDVSLVKPTSHVLDVENVFREDIVLPGLSQQEALAISVENMDGAFKVPKVIE